MSKLNRNIEIRCPLCGNDLFKCGTHNVDCFVEAPDDAAFCCADCGSVYIKEELLIGNSGAIENTWQEMKAEVVKELKRRIAKTW